MRRTRVMPFVHLATAMPLDGAGYPEDLIIAKVLAGRPKDLEDALGLWRLRGRELDPGRVRSKKPP